MNSYAYPLDPLRNADPLGLNPVAGAVVGGAVGGPPGAAIGAVVGLAGGYGLFSLANSNSEISEDENQKIQDKRKNLEYENYKNRCNEQPPKNENQCDVARWKLERNKDCKNMRSDWDNRWFPGRHENDIVNLERGIENLSKWIDRNCK
jgi:hypothetical protein